MKRIEKFATPWWMGGVALAAAGIVVARIVAPGFDASVRPAVAVAGELLALGGLVVIATGVSRRVTRGSP